MYMGHEEIPTVSN